MKVEMTKIEAVHEPHVINNLDDAVALLRQALDDQLDHYELRIADLEKFSMHLTGDKFHQTITPTVHMHRLDIMNLQF